MCYRKLSVYITLIFKGNRSATSYLYATAKFRRLRDRTEQEHFYFDEQKNNNKWNIILKSCLVKFCLQPELKKGCIRDNAKKLKNKFNALIIRASV